ncbi:MAG: HD domain-containing protein [Rubripirellula sp.]|nr:HD domain-containing protein [Rubripirellula sp.]
MNMIQEISAFFNERGESLYGGELISQRDHALQAATLAENDYATPALITAALLHDIGHLLHDLPEDSTDMGVDDEHETLGEQYLGRAFGPDVTVPVRLHVPAKRYLCAVEPAYMNDLSAASKTSLSMQGGPLSVEEIRAFEGLTFWRDAVRVRRWDDLAKVEGITTPPFSHFTVYLEEALETS